MKIQLGIYPYLIIVLNLRGIILAIMSYKEITLDIDQNKKNIAFITNKLLENMFPESFEKLIEDFNTIYQTRLDYHQNDDTTDYLKLRRLVTEYKPALEIVLDSGPECDQMIG